MIGFASKRMFIIFCVFLSATVSVFAQGFGDGVGMSTLSEGLLKFGLYGKDYVDIGYAAKTSSYGVVGSDGNITIAQNATVRGDILAGGLVIGNTGNIIGDDVLAVPGTISANKSVTFLNGLNVVAGSIYTPDSINLNGAGGSNIVHGTIKSGSGIKLGAGNTFIDTVVTSNDHIVANSYQSNTFGPTTVNLGSRTQYDATTDAAVKYIKWNTAFSRPAEYAPVSYTVPTTTVAPGSVNCTVPGNGNWWKPSYCDGAVPSGTAPNGQAYLLPGSYGDLILQTGNTKIILGEGIYHFRSIVMQGNDDSIVVYQPSGGRTQILVDQTMTFSYQSNLVPYTSAGNQGGTILLYYAGTTALTIRQNNYVWATIVAPNALVEFAATPGAGYSKAFLFGQVFAKAIKVAQDYEGNNGRYIPFYPTKPTINLVFSSGNTMMEGNSGSLPFTINFAMDHVNGLPVTVIFHTQVRTPAGPGNAEDPGDYIGTVKDSVTFAPGVTSVAYTGIQVKGDLQFEADDYFDLVLDTVINGQLDANPSNNKYALGILNDDLPPAFSFASASTITVSESLGHLAIGTKLNAASIIAATANLTLTAKTGSMGAGIPATNTIAAGATTGTFDLTWTNDALDEPDDTIDLVLSAGSGMSLGTPSTLRVIITNDDPPVQLSSPIQNFTVSEPLTGETTLNIPVTLNAPSGWNVGWGYELVGGTASGSDFSVSSKDGVIASGGTSGNLVLKIKADSIEEADETILLRLDPLFASHLGYDPVNLPTISVTITNNDGPVAQDDTISLAENPPDGYILMKLDNLIQSSPDQGALANGDYTWGTPTGPDAAFFTVEKVPVSGWVLKIKSSADFDFESRPTHVFDVTIPVVGNFPEHATSASIHVNLSDVQESPVIAPAAGTSVLENTTAGTPVDTLYPGDNSGWDLVWTIIGGTGADQFEITTTPSGAAVVTVKEGANLDFEAIKDLTLTVVLKNQNGLEDTVTIPVSIKNVLEYTQVNITKSETPGGNTQTDPKIIWINDDQFYLDWNYEGKDSLEVVQVSADGVTLVIRKYCDPTKDFCGIDTLIVRRNTKVPEVSWVGANPFLTLPKYTVTEPRATGDPVVYINDPNYVFGGTITYVDSLGNTKTITFQAPTTYEEGKAVTVRYSYTDPYGNTVMDSMTVVLDTKPPVVKIISPRDGVHEGVYNVDVVWSVDGVIMDTLNRASLVSGENKLIRNYVDLAGNIGADTVIVYLDIKNNDILVDLVNPMVTLDPKKVAAVELKYPGRDDERFSLGVINQESLEEEEAAWGNSGTVNEVSPGTGHVYDGTVKTHLGPTLRIEAKFQQVGGTNGEGQPRGGTLADLLERVQEQGGSVDDALCGQAMPTDTYTTPLWDNRLKVDVRIFDNMGQYVDNFAVIQDSITSKYLNDGGVAVFYFTMEPDRKEMRLKTSKGRAVGNGAYIMEASVKAISTYLWCAGDYRKGDKVVTSQGLQETFGYRRAE